MGIRARKRLERIQDVAGVDELRREYRDTDQVDRGDITDEAITDLGAEIVALDFLLQSGFSNIRKIVDENEGANADILADRDDKHYAIEITRKRGLRAGSRCHIAASKTVIHGITKN